MEQETVSRLITDNMKTVLGFALSRLNDPQEAEILASDILYALLKSAPKLRDESKFYPFMWRVAENTFVNYLRGKRPAKAEITDESSGSDPVEEEILLREDLTLLRRELTLLSANYRTATVLYYMEDKSCTEIAETLGTSAEMVKYYLFRARKVLREGMNMNRVFGEKSYNPKMFEIDFYGEHGGEDSLYTVFRQRKILGNILLAAYYAPVTVQELSIELGVAVPYLEDELNLLTEKFLLVRKNGRYQTNIPVFTQECTEEIELKTRTVIREAAQKFMQASDTAFRECYGSRFADENLLRWQIVTLCSHFSLERLELLMKETYGSVYPADDVYRNLRGGSGVVWGCSFSAAVQPKSSETIKGIYRGRSADGRGEVIAINFGQIRNAQVCSGSHLDAVSCTGVGCYAYLPKECREFQLENGYVIDGRPNFAVYTSAEYSGLANLLNEPLQVFTDAFRKNLDCITRITVNHAPDSVRKTAQHTAAFVYQFSGVERLVGELYADGWLGPVEDSAKPALCVIDRTR